MTAAQMYWTQIKHFSASEWPTGVLEYMEASLIIVLDDIRKATPPDCYMRPSPVPEGHVRMTGDSRHSTKNHTRLSDASDLFLEPQYIWTVWEQAQRQEMVGGLGLYFDTHIGGKPTPMIHIDLRQERVMWVRKDNYTYLHTDPAGFFHVLADNVGIY